MLVFGFLKRRKFHDFKNNAKDDATGVFIRPGCARGLLCSRTLFRIYIHSAWVSLYSFKSNGLPTPQKADG